MTQLLKVINLKEASLPHVNILTHYYTGQYNYESIYFVNSDRQLFCCLGQHICPLSKLRVEKPISIFLKDQQLLHWPQTPLDAFVQLHLLVDGFIEDIDVLANYHLHHQELVLQLLDLLHRGLALLLGDHQLVRTTLWTRSGSLIWRVLTLYSLDKLGNVTPSFEFDFVKRYWYVSRFIFDNLVFTFR